MQDNEQHQAVEAARTRIVRGDLPPIADADLPEALEILGRHGRPTGVNVRLADGRTQSGDLVLATAGLPPVLRARALARWHARQARSAHRQARRGSSRKPHLRRFAVAHSRAAARLSGARPRGCDRQARPRARRTGSSSRTSGSDPPPPPPRPSAEAEAVAR